MTNEEFIKHINGPASPNMDYTYARDGEIAHYSSCEGFSKLEKAALMIAQGLVSNPEFGTHRDDDIGEDSVKIAKAILREANK